MRLKGKVALITGGGSGIGEAAARLCAREGAAVVNNAGNVLHTGWLHEMTDQAWSESLDVFLNGVFRMCRAAIPPMIKNGGGSIINISTVAAMYAIPGWAAHPYAVVKAGVNILTRTIAIQYAGYKIRCNAICPAGVDTSLLDGLKANPKAWESFNASYPLGRVGSPKEIAQAVLYFASDESAWTTGTILVLDGGMTAKSA